MTDKDQERTESTPVDKSVISGETYMIPPEGSLGLLALGAVGLREWRIVRDEAIRQAELNQSANTDPDEMDNG